METVKEFFETINLFTPTITIVLTALLAAAAVIAAIFTGRNLKVLRGQFRYNTFQVLLKELAEPQARENREIIFQTLSSSELITNRQEGIIKERIDLKRCKKAVEETVSCLDRLGFFLLKGDPMLKEEAPDWIWTITSQMWARTEWYVKHRGKNSKHYGEYFKKLAEETKERGYVEQFETEQN